MADPKHPPPLRRGVQTADRAVVRERQAIPGDRAEYDIARSTPRCRYSHEGRRDTGQHRPLPDISAMQDAGRSRSTYYWMTGHPGTERADCVSASWCSTVWALFQQRRRLVSNRNRAVGTRRPFPPGYLVMRACSLPSGCRIGEPSVVHGAVDRHAAELVDDREPRPGDLPELRVEPPVSRGAAA